jgi:hypothetical protein
MVKGRRPPQFKKKKRVGILLYSGLYLSRRYAALLRGAHDELVEDNLFPIFFPPLVESKSPLCFVPVPLSRSRSRGQSSSGLYSGRGSEAARLPALLRSTPQSCSGPGRSSDRSSSGPCSGRSSEAGVLPLRSRALARAAPGQAGVVAGAAPE